MTAVVTLLYLMFSTDGDEPVHREALFGSLFFETRETSEGGLGVTMGVANPAALIAMFIVFAAVLTMTQFTYQGLKLRRDQLIRQRSGA